MPLPAYWFGMTPVRHMRRRRPRLWVACHQHDTRYYRAWVSLTRRWRSAGAAYRPGRSRGLEALRSASILRARHASRHAGSPCSRTWAPYALCRAGDAQHKGGPEACARGGRIWHISAQNRGSEFDQTKATALRVTPIPAAHGRLSLGRHGCGAFWAPVEQNSGSGAADRPADLAT